MSNPLRFKLVEDSNGFASLLSDLRNAKRIGIDTEADSRHHYPEKVCLLQLSTGNCTYIIDTLAGIDIRPIGAIFEDKNVEKILHGADFDIRGLNRDWGFVTNGIYDTNIAARFAGLERFGLAGLIEDLLGTSILKDPKLQKADWSRRPLSDSALGYAAGDVAYLFDIRDRLDSILKRLRRQEWVKEECQRLSAIRYIAPDSANAFRTMKGAGGLSGREMAVLRELFDLRDFEARRLDRPPSFVISTETMLYLSRHPESPLGDVPGLGKIQISRIGRKIMSSLSRGMSAPPVPRRGEGSRPRPTKQETNAFSALKKWRAGIGNALKIDPSLLWPTRSLERLSRNPRVLEEEIEGSEVRAWQSAEFSKSIELELQRLESEKRSGASDDNKPPKL